VAPARQLIWGGSIGYRTRASTFLASYNRSGYDSSAASVGTNTSYSGAWNWRHPRSAWGFHATYMRNETANTGFSNLSGWQGRLGVSRSLSNNLSVLLDGSYLSSRGTFLGVENGINVHAIRLSLGWTPRLSHTAPAPAEENEQIP
jgi:hypothetical protein